jgi:hypothetical protein
MRVAMIQRDDAGDIRAAALYERAHEPGLDDDELMRRIADYHAVQTIVVEEVVARLRAERASRDVDVAMR